MRNAIHLEINTKKENKNYVLCYFYFLNANVVYEESLLIIHYFNEEKNYDFTPKTYGYYYICELLAYCTQQANNYIVLQNLCRILFECV